MKLMRIYFLAATLIIPLLAQPSSTPKKNPDSSSPTDWFVRADDLTNLRLPGATPFHLRATFQASPGLDFAKP
jgi:hypothetical protein